MPAPEEAQAAVDFYQKNRDHLEATSPKSPSGFFELSHWQNQLAMNLKEFADDRSLKLFLFEHENPYAIIGSASFNNFVRGAGQYCSLGYSLAADKQGMGFMTEALPVAIQYVFQTLNLHRIQANYMPWNERSGKVSEKLGFEKEGFAPRFLRINGQWEDHVMTALINANWDSTVA